MQVQALNDITKRYDIELESGGSGGGSGDNSNSNVMAITIDSSSAMSEPNDSEGLPVVSYTYDKESYEVWAHIQNGGIAYVIEQLDYGSPTMRYYLGRAQEEDGDFYISFYNFDWGSIYTKDNTQYLCYYMIEYRINTSQSMDRIYKRTRPVYVPYTKSLD